MTTTLGPTVTDSIQPDFPTFESPTPSIGGNNVLTDTSNMPSPNPSESGSSVGDNEDIGDCSIGCEHGGICILGYRDATDLEFALDHNFDPNVPVKNSAQTQSCDCPSAYSGILCEHFNEDITCEKASCENGSTCKAIPYDDPATTAVSLPVCSCEFNGTHHFAGVGCSEPSTSFCTNSPGMNGFQFCTNNGKCRETLKGIFECDCINGFKGPHCEFAQEQQIPPFYDKCDLFCENGGKCVKGIKEEGFLAKLTDVAFLINNTNLPAFEYCVCPQGYAGNRCEHVAHQCPESEHVCFHGSECVKSGEDYKCNCDVPQKAGVSSAIHLAGPYCQHKATSECESEHFCVNNGVCQDGGTCQCPKPFRGKHCELREIIADIDGMKNGTFQGLPKSYQDRVSDEILVSSGIVVTLAILAVIFVVRITVVNVETTDYDPPGLHVPPVSAFPPASQSSTSEVEFEQQKKLEDVALHDIPIVEERKEEEMTAVKGHPPSDLERSAWSQEII